MPCSRNKQLPARTGFAEAQMPAIATVLLTLSLGTSAGMAQQLPPAPAPVANTAPQLNFHSTTPAGWLFSAYKSPVVRPSSNNNSQLPMN